MGMRTCLLLLSTEGSNLTTLGQIMLDNYTGNALASVQQLGLLPQGLRAQTWHPMAATKCLLPGISSRGETGVTGDDLYHRDTHLARQVVRGIQVLRVVGHVIAQPQQTIREAPKDRIAPPRRSHRLHQLSPDLHYPSVASLGAKEGLIGVKIAVGFHSSQFPTPVCAGCAAGSWTSYGPSLLQTTRVNIQTRITEGRQLPGQARGKYIDLENGCERPVRVDFLASKFTIVIEHGQLMLEETSRDHLVQP
ncbi:hypothetical protein DUI87_08323 [Hirundo rustica rustica]|uniref:Uncharacterized protein n=1 Tax=Hirundo rustica rustica TaxID=333673 RepID=A0A3M0KXE2_HIRRU|nr:hypothetical protein DUI87_08323 [Hirundo rustica rustica]